MFKVGKRRTTALFCDFSSSWVPDPGFFEHHGFKWPDDFEHAESVGEARIQIIEDYQSGLSLFNHSGILYPIIEKKIIERRYKVKEKVVVERFGRYIPFQNNNVYFLETGYKSGSVDYMVFKYRKDQSSFRRFREVLYQFPLSTLTQIVLRLRELHSKDLSRMNDLEKQENEEILNHQAFKGWEFMQRETSPSEDEYVERCEMPLYNYHFQNSYGIDTQIRFTFSQG